MKSEEIERRRFMIELEKVKLLHDFYKNGFLMVFFMFVLGGLFLVFKPFKESVLIVIIIGLFVAMAGLVTLPKSLVIELDKLVPKEK